MLVVTSWSFARDRNAGIIVHFIIMSAIAAYLIVYVVPRDRFPIEPFFIVLASMTVDWLAIRGGWRHLPREQLGLRRTSR